VSTVVDKFRDWMSGPDVGEEEDYGGPELTIVEHLQELRARLTRCAIALVIGTIIGLIFSEQIFQFLLKPAPAGFKPVFIEMTEMFTTYFKVAIMTGAAIAMPVFVYQVLAFVGPGLTRKERRIVLTRLPLVSILFVAGAMFGFFVVLPFATRYLLTFSDVASAEIRIGNYIGFVMTVLFWLGLAFETPLIISLLVAVRLVRVEQLTRFRKFAVLAVFIVAAAITPTPDPFNQTLVAVPLYLLYELGILFARLSRPTEEPPATAPTA
jgi:sec-independent protein translocase protein TatC